MCVCGGGVVIHIAIFKNFLHAQLSLKFMQLINVKIVGIFNTY